MIGSHGFGQGYFGQGPLTTVQIAVNIARGMAVYVRRAFAVGVRVVRAVGKGSA